MINWFWDAESQWWAAIEGHSTDVSDGWRKEDCIYWFAVSETYSPMNSRLIDNRMNIREWQPRKASLSMRVTASGIVTRTRDLQPMKAHSWMVVTDGWKMIFVVSSGARSSAPISVDGGCEVWNDLRRQVSTQPETIFPTSIFVNPRDCEGPSLHRESEFTPPLAAHEPCVEYHVVMFKLHIYTVATAAWNAYDKHGYRCNGWLLDTGRRECARVVVCQKCAVC